MLPSVGQGQRLIVSGRCGSGKSTLANWLAWRSPGKWIIINPKFTAAYDSLPDCELIDSLDFDSLIDALENPDVRFINLRPGLYESTAEALDEFILDLHLNYKNVGILCDELYTLHIRGQAGPGLTAWLTRGRELGQSFIGLTQRPAWVSRFVFSEADFICALDLTLKDDRKRIFEMTGQEGMEERIAPKYWKWYDVNNDEMTTYGPVPLR